MEIKKIYNKLYHHWLNEFNEKELTSLTHELVNEYKNIVDKIDKFNVSKENDIKREIVFAYKKNITYLYNDFLKLREIKLLNAALTQNDISLNNLTDAEKLYFQNLVSTIRGFKKIRELSKGEQIEIKNQKESSKMVLSQQNTMDLSPHHESEKHIEQNLSEAGIIEEEFNYTLIKFLKKTPPLVGVDLITYGPFKKEDIANLPLKNAKILIYEKFAEKINLN